MLARNTLRVYSSKLKRLRRLLTVMPVDHPDRTKVIAEVERYTNVLGREMTTDEINEMLARKPGRPPKVQAALNVSRLEGELTVEPEPKQDWTPGALDARAAARRDKYERSQNDLQHLMQLAKEDVGQH